MDHSVKSLNTTDKSAPKIIFFGNGPFADHSLTVLSKHCEIIFHAREKSDLTPAADLKRQFPTAHGVLASFGVLIKPDFLQLFEPEGILNLHPSLLPHYRGPSPIESAIIAGDNVFGYSIMKLAQAMDAGPIYHQTELDNLPIDKSAIYQSLATAGSQWLVDQFQELEKSHQSSLSDLITPTPQDDSAATYTKKFQKSDSFLHPEDFPAATILRQIIALQGFPKPKYEFFGKTCIILQAHVLRVTDILCEAAGIADHQPPLMLKCADRNFVVIDQLQPADKKPMDAKSFINGYAK